MLKKSLNKSAPLLALTAAVVVAIVIAVRPSGPPPAPTPQPAATEAPTSLGGGPTNSESSIHHQGLGGATGALPPGHPAIPNGTGAASGSDFVAEKPEVGIVWTAPPRWVSVDHPSTMRIATYRIPHVASDTVDGELSVTRVGGGTDANVDRWLGQFDATAKATMVRTSRVISGFNVVVVEMRGTYSGMGQDAQPGWALLGAVIETPGQAHFLKLTGPAKTVEAARAELDAMLATIRPK